MKDRRRNATRRPFARGRVARLPGPCALETRRFAVFARAPTGSRFPMAQAQARSLVAVFDTETHAQQAARQIEALGVAHDDIRIGDSLDALASVQGEMRQEASGVVAGP